MVKLAETDDEITGCFQAIKLLRTKIEENEFVALIRELMPDGYQLAYIKNKKEFVCVAGFRISKNLAGKNLYVEDIATLEDARSKGFGLEMMNWLRKIAKKNKCKFLHLDSPIQFQRAHKFYMGQNLYIAGYHFAEIIK